jgi:hypothetical protein
MKQPLVLTTSSFTLDVQAFLKSSTKSQEKVKRISAFEIDHSGLSGIKIFHKVA